jgi:LacI family transcriptional regulator
MDEHGLADEIAVATTYYTEEGGYDGARRLLSDSRRPTAIFAGADQAAFGALARSTRQACPSPATSRSPTTTTPAGRPAQLRMTNIDQDGGSR